MYMGQTMGPRTCVRGPANLELDSFLAPVAQLDRASDFGSEGWGFESSRARSCNMLYKWELQLSDGTQIQAAPPPRS